MIQLITDTGTITLDRGELALDLAIADLRDVNVSKTDASKTLCLPATCENLRVFGYSDLLEFAPDAPTFKMAAWLTLDGVSIAKGWLRVTRIEGSQIEVVLLSGNGDLIGELEEARLTDIDFSDEVHTYSYANVVGSWTNFDLRSYIYPLVDYGAFELPYWQTKEMRPAINVKEVLTRMIKEHGYTLVSNFVAGDYFSRMYMLGGGIRDLDKTLTQPREFVAVTTTSPTWTVDSGAYLPVFDNDLKAAANYSTTTGRYTFDFAFKARFESVVSLQYAGGSNQSEVMGALLRVRRIRGGVDTIVAETAIDIPVTFNSVTESPFDMTVTADYMEFKAGDQVYIEIDGNCDDILRQYQVTGGASYLATLSSEILPGSPVNPGLFLPDNTQLELLQAIKHKYNLQIWANSLTRKVYIEPFDDFYGTPDTAVDWTAYVDRMELPSISTPDIQTRRLVMTYAEDSDYNIEQYKDDLPFSAGAYEFTTPGGHGDHQEQCAMFAATYMDTCPRQWVHLADIPVIWMEDPDEVTGVPERSYDHAPRLLYFKGMESKGVWLLDYQQQTQIPVFLSESMAELMERYYRRSLHMMDTGHTVTFRMVLDSNILLNFDPRKLVKVDNAYYLVNAINNWTETGQCDVELLQWKAKGKAQGATITGNTVPPPQGKVKKTTAVYVLDTRFRPPQVFPVYAEDDNGYIQQVEVER